MVALVTRGTDRAAIAIHRTFLARNCQGKAPIKPDKMMLGPCRDGVVRLGFGGGVLMIGEGIETSLSAMQSTGHATWAAFSTSGLRALDLPNDPRDIIVLANGDEPAEAAAQNCARRRARELRLGLALGPDLATAFNHHDAGEAHPGVTLHESIDGADDRHGSGLDASVALLHRLVA